MNYPTNEKAFNERSTNERVAYIEKLLEDLYHVTDKQHRNDGNQARQQESNDKSEQTVDLDESVKEFKTIKANLTSLIDNFLENMWVYSVLKQMYSIVR